MPPTSLSSILPAPPNSEAKGRRLLTPTTNAIPSIVAKDGRKYNALHTMAVTALFALQFRALVTDPYRVMLLDLIPLLVLQCAYCVVCLPATGTWPNTSCYAGNEAAGNASGKGAKGAVTGSLRKRPAGMGRIGAAASGGWKGKVMPTVIALALTMLLPPIPLTVLAHVLGAPLYPTVLILNTAVLCLHISLLSCLPLFYTHGVSGPAWRDVVAAWLPFDEAGVWGGSVGCFVGGWLGAIPIALDWDRDWQAWPITVMAGCYGGWAAGKTLLGPIFLQGRRIDMSVGPEDEATETYPNARKRDRKLQ